MLTSSFPHFSAVLMLAIICLPTEAGASTWSERKRDKAILKIDRDLTQKALGQGNYP